MRTNFIVGSNRQRRQALIELVQQEVQHLGIALPEVKRLGFPSEPFSGG